MQEVQGCRRCRGVDGHRSPQVVQEVGVGRRWLTSSSGKPMTPSAQPAARAWVRGGRWRAHTSIACRNSGGGASGGGGACSYFVGANIFLKSKMLAPASYAFGGS